MSAFWVNKVKKMKVGNPLSKAVLLYLADCTTDKGCFPSQELISHDLEMSIDSVRRHIRHLEQIGVLVKSQRQAGNRVLKSEYSIVDSSREQPLDGSTQLVSDGSSLMVSHSKDAESKHAESRVDGSREQPSHNKEVLTTNNDNNKRGTLNTVPKKKAPLASAFGKPHSPSDFFSQSENALVAATENALGFALDTQTTDRLMDTVPESEQAEWINLVKDRMCNHVGDHPNFIRKRLGYWFGDFRKTLKARPKYDAKGFAQHPTPVSKWYHEV